MPAGVTLTPRLVAAGWIEIVCGTLILIGLLTRPAAFLASGEMAFAYFMGHFPHGFWPIQNHGEPAVLFCFLFLFLVANGPGPFSLDHVIWRRRPAARTCPAAPSSRRCQKNIARGVDLADPGSS